MTSDVATMSPTSVTMDRLRDHPYR